MDEKIRPQFWLACEVLVCVKCASGWQAEGAKLCSPVLGRCVAVSLSPPFPSFSRYLSPSLFLFLPPSLSQVHAFLELLSRDSGNATFGVPSFHTTMQRSRHAAGLQLAYFVLSDAVLLAVATSSVLGASATSQDSSHPAQTSDV